MSQSRRKAKLYAQRTEQNLPQPQTPALAEPLRPEKPKFDYSQIYNSKILLTIAMIGICALAIYIRTGLIHNQGVFEPDGFFYYAWLKAVIANHLSVPAKIALTASGVKGLGEAPMLIVLPAIPAVILAPLGITPLQVMRWIPVIFALMEMLLAYLIITRLSKSRWLGLLAMAFIAISSGNVARTAALVFRGDTFITVPLMAAIYLLILAIESNSPKKVMIYALSASFVTSLGILIWTGGAVISAVIALALMLLVIYSFLKNNKWLSKKTMVCTIFLGLVLIFQEIYISLNMARSYSELVGTSFLMFYLPLLIISVLTYLILEYKPIGIFSKTRIKAALLAAIIIGGTIIIVVAFPTKLAQITPGLSITAAPTNSSDTANAIAYAVSSTTQELQKPTFEFLFSSFNLAFFLAPIGFILFLLFSESINNNEDGIHINKTILNSNIGTFIILSAYFAAMIFLQYNAIRYNSMLSIPMAIFSAYAIYACIKLGGRLKGITSKHTISYVGLIFFGLVITLYEAYTIYNQGFHYLGLSFIPVAALLLIDTIIAIKSKKLSLQRLAIAMFIIIIIYGATFAIFESFGSSPADGVNPAFLQAMTWMSNNTTPNSVTLALWPDGSVVEGWGNRTSYMDSVGGENGSRIYPFAQFLIANNSDTGYLYNTNKPKYLVARYYWLAELSGLVTEGVPAQGTAAYSYEQLTPTKTSQINATASEYQFSDGSVNATFISQTMNNATEYSVYLNAAGALGLGNPVKHLIFYNSSSGAYSINNFTNSTSNYDFMILYSGRQISEGILLTSDLYESNLFKFLFLCKNQECSYNQPGQNATMDLIYQNSDSKIYQINYTR